MSKFNLIDSNICNNGKKNNKGKKEKKPEQLDNFCSVPTLKILILNFTWAIIAEYFSSQQPLFTKIISDMFCSVMEFVKHGGLITAIKPAG